MAHSMTTPFPVMAVKSSLSQRPTKTQSIEPLKLPELVVKSAPAGIRRKSKNHVYKYKVSHLVEMKMHFRLNAHYFLCV